MSRANQRLEQMEAASREVETLETPVASPVPAVPVGAPPALQAHSAPALTTGVAQQALRSSTAQQLGATPSTGPAPGLPVSTPVNIRTVKEHTESLARYAPTDCNAEC
eukprot:459621-Amphidinium_carterae.1